MAKPTTLRFGAGAFYLGDGATPEVFTKLCGFESVTLTVDKTTNDTTVADCDDPDAAAWTERDAVALGWSFSFQGVMAVGSLDLIEAATFATAAQNVRFDLAGAGTGAGTTVRRYAGAAHIKHELSGNRNERFQVKVDGEGDGALVQTSVAAA
jgi:hypothetical protein